MAFGLVGLELHSVVGTAAGRGGELLGWGLVGVGVVVGVRLAWLLPATWLAKRLHTGRDVGEEIPISWRETVVMWWAGMRGVASVALALAIPLETDDGQPFPVATRSSSSPSP
ncbi:Na+/H+ antiporter OS=Streptomyces microflavus OX=1919 GN=G3I39_25435 PE=3 SV=1 [Streptomyces microflavus]